MVDAEPDRDAGSRRILETGSIEAPLRVDAGRLDAMEFDRADLVFTGVRHDADTYEVRVFLDNPEATLDTPCTPDAGFAGAFTVLGHGGCFGAEGHCRTDLRPADPIPALTGTQRGDPLARQWKFITITRPLRRAIEQRGEGLIRVILVPVVPGDAPEDDRVSAEAFGFDRMRLEIHD